MDSPIIKAILITTGIMMTAMSMFLKASVPMAIDFSSSFPIIWSSFLSCMKPPYVFAVVNVIISIIIAFSRYYPTIGALDDSQDENTLNGGYDQMHTEPIINQPQLRQLEVKDVNFDFEVSPVAEEERSNDVYDEKDEEILGLIDVGTEQMSHEEQDLKFDAFIQKMKDQMRHEEQNLEFGEFM